MSKNYAFTHNNPTFPVAHLRPGEPYSYFVYQLERAPTTGTPHLQGYFITARKSRLETVRKQHPGLDIEIRRRDHEAMRDYCTKSDTRVAGPWEWGTPPHQGSRSDLAEIQKMARTGGNLREIMNDHYGSFVRYHKGITLSLELYRAARSSFLEAICFWGPTGTGKSHCARNDYPGAYWAPAVSPGSGLWFDGYMGESDIVLDEFTHTSLSLNTLLRLCDKYPLRLPCKGGFVNVVATRVIITTNLDPALWYPDSGLRFHALLRRLSFRFMPKRYVV